MRNVEQFNNNVTLLSHQISHFQSLMNRFEQSTRFVPVPPQKSYGKVIDFKKLGFNCNEQSKLPLCKKKYAVINRGIAEIKDVSISITSEQIEIIDASHAEKRFILTLDELIQLAEERGLFR